jgi:integrase
MRRQIRFTRKVIESLPPCPADHSSREIEFSSVEAPPGLKLVVTKRGIKSWLLRYTIIPPGQSESQRRAIKLGEFPAMEPSEACQIALEMRAQIAKRIDPQDARDKVAEEPTLDQFFQKEYLPHARTTLRSAKDVEGRWRLHVAPVLGTMRMRDIKPGDVLRLHDSKRTQLCAASANRILALVKRVFNVGIMLERCDKNPCRGVRMHAEQNIRNRTLAGEELKRFVAALVDEPNRVAADFFLYALATAGRREECLQMTWGEVSLERETWTIPASRSKNGKSRTVPLNDVALQVLRNRLALQRSQYVFPGRDSGPFNNPSKAFKRVLERAGIVDLKIHDLRRSAATILVNNGGSIGQAQKLLGHSSSTLTATRYAFLAESQVRDASQRVSNAITEACGLPAG